jgi:hypothetical protein
MPSQNPRTGIGPVGASPPTEPHEGRSVETWKPVPGTDGRYSVSDEGRVRGAFGRVLKAQLRADGRRVVDVWVGGVRSTRTVSQLVLEAFVGPRPADGEGRHKNGDPGDNRLANLQWGSKAENTLDSVAHGTHANASKTHCKHDHEFTEANTIWTKSGARRCRACKNEQMKQYRRKER